MQQTSCQNCQTTLSPDDMYCGECGTRITESQMRAHESSPDIPDLDPGPESNLLDGHWILWSLFALLMVTILLSPLFELGFFVSLTGLIAAIFLWFNAADWRKKWLEYVATSFALMAVLHIYASVGFEAGIAENEVVYEFQGLWEHKAPLTEFFYWLLDIYIWFPVLGLVFCILLAKAGVAGFALLQKAAPKTLVHQWIL